MMQILQDGKDLEEQFSYANYWIFNRLCYMALNFCDKNDLPGGTAYVQEVEKAVTKLYEIVYPGDDMGFEDLRLMCIMHSLIAEDEISLGGDEETVKYELNRALEYAQKSVSVEAHDLPHPLVRNWHVEAAPSDRKQVVRFLQNKLSQACFDSCRKAEWFAALQGQADVLEGV